MQVELFYFDGCPSWQTALDNLQTVLADWPGAGEVRLTRIQDEAQAVQVRFVGSPTIRLDGQDIFPTNQQNYALGCRIYNTPDGLRGWPTVEMIREALQRVSYSK